MKKIISILLSAIILLTTGTAYATETKSADISYNILPVEFSDNLGTTENLDAMVDDGHLYVNAKQLGERLGYQVKAGDEYVAIFNKEFSNTVPYGITTFYYDSTKVGHMLFNKMVDYEAPFETVKNADGEWIPFEFSLLLLNSSDVVLDKKIHVDMPEKNIVDIYMDVLKNNDRYLFDWEADAGATPGSMFAMGTAANMVQIFNGVLDWDGASWCQLINSFSMDSSSYDAKYSESFAKMFCTYSDEELSQDVDAMKEKLKPFNGDNWVVKSMKQIDDAYDYKIENLSKKTADLKKKMVVENKASVDAYNKSYQELDKLCSRADFFSETTDPFVQVSKSFKEATGFMEAFYSVMEITGYASEFQNQDKFAVKSLDTFIKNSNYGCVMSKAMKDGLRDYKNTLETDIVSYSAYNYLMNNMGDLLKEGLDVSTTLLDTESKIYLLIWDISKETVPWVKNGLSNTDCFLQSMYAGIVQSDTFKSYIDKRDTVFKDANNITSKNLYEVTQYCYAYLKSCYITRDAAVGALTEKTKEDNPTYESTQKMVNQEIAKCLVKLKDADKTNKYGCYGFLPENNKQYLSEYDDGTLIQCVINGVDVNSIYQEYIKNKEYNDYIKDEWKSNNPSQYAIIDIDQDGENELIIRDENDGCSSFSVFRYNDDEQKVIGIDIENILGYENEKTYHVSRFYGEMLYSSKYKAIVYHENGDPYLNQVVYQSIDGNVLKDKFSILVDTNNIEKKPYYTLYENSEKELSKSEYDAYLEDMTEVHWENIEKNDISIKLNRDEICKIVQQHYNFQYSANELSVNDYYDTEDGCIVIVRSSLQNEANGYFTSVNINFETGNATDEIGNVWNIYTK